jgi:hypothetical protein
MDVRREAGCETNEVGRMRIGNILNRKGVGEIGEFRH